MKPEQLEHRAREPVASCLIRRLIVPRIYFEADWPGGRVDVLAIDRDGVGDAHVVELRRNAADALIAIPRLLALKAPFRWIAYFMDTPGADKLSAEPSAVLYPPEGAGRIGCIEVVEMQGGDLGANIRIKAERFPEAVYDIATRFSGSHTANIQFGED